MAYYENHDVAPVGIGSCGACAMGGPIAVSGLGATDLPSIVKGGVVGALAGAGFMWLLSAAMGEDTKQHLKLGALFGGALGMFSAV